MYKGFDPSDKVAALTARQPDGLCDCARPRSVCAKIVVSSNAQEDTDQAAHALSKEGLMLRACDANHR